MSENILEKIIKKKIERIDQIKKSISLKSLDETIIENKSFVETPMPSIIIFFTLSGFIFFSLNLVLETVKQDFTSHRKDLKDFEIIDNENRS